MGLFFNFLILPTSLPLIAARPGAPLKRLPGQLVRATAEQRGDRVVIIAREKSAARKEFAR